MAEPTTPVGAITLNRVLAILLTVNDPCSVSWGAPLNVLEMGLVREAHIRDDGTIFLRLLLTEPTCIFFFDIATDIKARLQAEVGHRTALRPTLDGRPHGTGGARKVARLPAAYPRTLRH
jgi:metal-sulfur cluster biosynthetic enzyme